MYKPDLTLYDACVKGTRKENQMTAQHYEHVHDRVIVVFCDDCRDQVELTSETAAKAWCKAHVCPFVNGAGLVTRRATGGRIYYADEITSVVRLGVQDNGCFLVSLNGGEPYTLDEVSVVKLEAIAAENEVTP